MKLVRIPSFQNLITNEFIRPTSYVRRTQECNLAVCLHCRGGDSEIEWITLKELFYCTRHFSKFQTAG